MDDDFILLTEEEATGFLNWAVKHLFIYGHDGFESYTYLIAKTNNGWSIFKPFFEVYKKY